MVNVLSAKMCLLAVEKPDLRGNRHDNPTGTYIVGGFPNALVKMLGKLLKLPKYRLCDIKKKNKFASVIRHLVSLLSEKSLLDIF